MSTVAHLTDPHKSARARGGLIQQPRRRGRRRDASQSSTGAAAPIRGAARCRPTFVTAMASDTPYTQPALCASRVPPALPRRCSAHACGLGLESIGRRCLVPLRRPDRSWSANSCPELAHRWSQQPERESGTPWCLTRCRVRCRHEPSAQNWARSLIRQMIKMTRSLFHGC